MTGDASGWSTHTCGQRCRQMVSKRWSKSPCSLIWPTTGIAATAWGCGLQLLAGQPATNRSHRVRSSHGLAHPALTPAFKPVPFGFRAAGDAPPLADGGDLGEPVLGWRKSSVAGSRHLHKLRWQSKFAHLAMLAAPLDAGQPMYGRKQKMLLRHYLEQGLSRSAIAAQLGICRRTLCNWIDRGELDRDLDEEAVRYGPRPQVAGLLDPYRPLIVERLTAYPEWSATRLFAAAKAAGYGDSYSLRKAYVRSGRPKSTGRSGGALRDAGRPPGAGGLRPFPAAQRVHKA